MPRHYSLRSGEELLKANPKTFKVPPLKKRKALQAGDVAKLSFLPTGQQNDERMWVEVTHVDAYGSYTGKLLNEPALVNAKLGDPVSFTREHVIQIGAPAGALE
jgi:hypothetical protein